MNKQERRDWAEIVAIRQGNVDVANKHHWPHIPGDDAVLAADGELTANRAIVQAAREYVAALAEVTRVYDAGEMTVGDAQEICESKTDALIAAVGGAADATERRR